MSLQELASRGEALLERAATAGTGARQSPDATGTSSSARAGSSGPSAVRTTGTTPRPDTTSAAVDSKGVESVAPVATVTGSMTGVQQQPAVSPTKMLSQTSDPHAVAIEMPALMATSPAAAAATQPGVPLTAGSVTRWAQSGVVPDTTGTGATSLSLGTGTPAPHHHPALLVTHPPLAGSGTTDSAAAGSTLVSDASGVAVVAPVAARGHSGGQVQMRAPIADPQLGLGRISGSPALSEPRPNSSSAIPRRVVLMAAQPQKANSGGTPKGGVLPPTVKFASSVILY
jgi:hypothetical protein